ncbi:MAG: hypothetical protein ACLPR9_10540 [Acidimicrobiales bacterium]
MRNHVWVLRDAGLLAEERDGNRRTLTVQAQAVDDLLATLHDVRAGQEDPSPATTAHP